MGFFNFWKKSVSPPVSMVTAEEYKLVKNNLTTILNYLGESPSALINAEKLSERLKDSDFDAYKVAAAAAAIFMRVSAYRTMVIKAVNSIKNLYIVDSILSQVAEDALAPEAGSGELVEMSSDNEKIQSALSELQRKFNIDQILTDITPDLLGYGSYVLGLDVITFGEKDKDGNLIPIEKCGVIDIKDDVVQEDVVPVNRHGEIQTYLVLSANSSGVDAQKPWKYVSFSLGGAKQRIDLINEWEARTQDWDNDPVLNDIPRFLRVGKSIIYPVISKILELDLLEKLVPASQLAALSNGNLISVSVPASMEPEKALEACKKVEGLLNRKVGVDVTSKLVTVENIIAAAGRFKCVPYYGDGKGTMTSQNQVSKDRTEDIVSSIKDTRMIILSSIGIPYEIYYGDDSVETKGAILRRYARYLRKLKAVQTALEDGLRQLAYIHLRNKEIPFTTDDITITFRNKLIDVDLIDQLEFLDTTVGLLSNACKFVQELGKDEEMSKFVNKKELARFIDKRLEVLGMGSVLHIDDGEIKPRKKPVITALKEKERPFPYS